MGFFLLSFREQTLADSYLNDTAVGLVNMALLLYCVQRLC